MRADSGMRDNAFDAAIAALRWVTDGAVAADGGVTWPRTRASGAPLTDELYDGTAGVLVALAEARLGGIADFDDCARAAAGRLRFLASAGRESMAGLAQVDAEGEFDLGLYTGLSGCAAALNIWASVSGDAESAGAALAIAADIAAIAATGRPVSVWQDVTAGDAGIMLVLIEVGDAGVRPAISVLADRLAGAALWIDGEPDWYARPDFPVLHPNFSHGAAGIGYALAAAAAALDRDDLLEIAALAGRRLVRLGGRPDGTLAVPHSIPMADPGAPVSYGWCHGPTGTMRLFQLLEWLRPGQGWAGHAQACRRAVRASGLPERRYPGFWDNLGQCCGTAGVGEMALDSYAESADTHWLTWSAELARDVLGRCVRDSSGVRWSHTEHRLVPPDLEPMVGWMQGAAGIAGWLLRLVRVERDGAGAPRLRWPDRPPIG